VQRQDWTNRPAQRQDSSIAALDHAVRADDGGTAVGLRRIAKAVRIERSYNGADLRLARGAVALARL
jgi:hypothetical protein